MAYTPRPVGADEADRLDALLALNILDTAPEPEFDTITRLVASVFDVPMALISLVDANRQWFKSSVGLEATETPCDISFCGHAIASDELMVVPDATKDFRFRQNPLVLGPPNVRFYAGAPLKLASGHRIGTLCIIDTRARAPMSAREQEIRATAPDEPIVLLADSTELMQVLMNLAINARDAVEGQPDGCVELRVGCWAPGDAAPEPQVGRLPAGPAACIELSDNGCGIPADVLGRIFQPFYSSKGNRGTGLGLSVVAGIIEAAGGGISVASTVGKGTRFTILWPLDPPLDPPVDPPVDAPVRLAGASSQPGCRLAGRTVLVVDDNLSIVELLRGLLEQMGAEVGPCGCAADVLAALGSDPQAWDLLVTDFDMPDMDGAALAAAARLLKPDLPILLCTGAPGPHLERHRHQPLFDAIIGKPPTAESVLAGAEAALAARA